MPATINSGKETVVHRKASLRFEANTTTPHGRGLYGSITPIKTHGENTIRLSKKVKYLRMLISAAKWESMGFLKDAII